MAPTIRSVGRSAPKATKSKAAKKVIKSTKPAKNSMTAAKKAVLQAKIDAGLVKPMKQALRTEVYRYCLVQEGKTKTVLHHGTTNWAEGAKILRLNKEIYNEAAPIFYGENNFEVWTANGDVYSHISKQNAKFVKEVTIHSGRPFLAVNMNALKEFTELKTLNLTHSKGWELPYGAAPHTFPVPGSFVGHFKEIYMKSSTTLPQLPEEALERIRPGHLTFNVFVQLEAYDPALFPIPTHGPIPGKHIGPWNHPTWATGRVDRYELVVAPKTVMPGRMEIVWKGRLGVPYGLVFSGESRVISSEDDHL